MLALLFKQDANVIQEGADCEELINQSKVLVIVELCQVLYVFNHWENELERHMYVL